MFEKAIQSHDIIQLGQSELAELPKRFQLPQTCTRERMPAPYFDIVEEWDGVVGQVVVHEVLGHLAEQTHFRQGEQICQGGAISSYRLKISKFTELKQIQGGIDMKEVQVSLNIMQWQRAASIDLHHLLLGETGQATVYGANLQLLELVKLHQQTLLNVIVKPSHCQVPVVLQVVYQILHGYFIMCQGVVIVKAIDLDVSEIKFIVTKHRSQVDILRHLFAWK
ncbi:hypothetical protein E2C01_012258 [Portunus trituberculatus]|uniref:Uncharacterized protein n=1 Tax=Portunus trituberculatus TaxID=210409 RepID=A0A5B7DE25_PORTR|nr:hypothetical protein [Portunus trituberculatus]